MSRKTYSVDREQIFERGPRTKRVKQKDGSVKTYELKGGLFFRIHYKEPSGRPRVAEGGAFEKLRHVKAALKERRTEIEASHGLGQDRRGWTFRELTEYCLGPDGMYAEGKLRSRESVVYNIKRLNKFFGRFKLGDISREALRTYHRQRLAECRPTKEGEPKRHISHATVNRELATLRAMLFFAIGEGWTAYNPFFKLKLMSTKDENPRDRILTKEECDRLIAACVGTWKVSYTRKWKGRIQELDKTVVRNDVHLRALIELSLDCGFRRGESLELRWDDIDLDRMRVTVRPENSKTSKGRVMPLSDRLIVDLRELKKYSRDDRVFPFREFKRTFDTAKQISGLTDIVFHDLRRTHISIRAMRGENALAVGKSVGHSQLQTTLDHYTQITEMKLEEIRREVNAYNSEGIQAIGGRHVN